MKIKNKSRQIGIFVGLKVLEISGIFLILYLLYWIGRFFDYLDGGDLCNINRDCYLIEYIFFGFAIPFTIIAFILIVWTLILNPFIKTNWQWSKQINENL